MSESPNQEPGSGEPVRWLDDPSAGAGLRADLGHAAKAGAAGIDYAATLVGLRGAIAAQTGALAPAAIAGKSIGLKVAVGGLVIAGIAGLWALRGNPDSNGAGVAEAGPAIAVQTERAVDRAPTSLRAEPAPARVPAPAASPSSDREDTEDEKIELDDPPMPTGKPVKRPRPVESTAATPEPDAAAGDADTDRYLREAKLVAQARKQLGSDAASALASTQKHDREFPDGSLMEESHAIEIRALAKLGRMDDARREAEAFLREFGDGPHAAAVRRAVAGDDDVQ